MRKIILLGFLFSVQMLAQTAIVNCSCVMYPYPDITSKAQADLYKGDSVMVLSSSEKWTEIYYDMKFGYIKRAYLDNFPDNVNQLNVKSPFTKEGMDLNGFRNSDWGSTIKQVRKNEKLTEQEYYEGYLIYSGSIAGLDANIYYSFIDEKLVTGSYIISKVHVTNDLYVNDYYKLQAILIEKYGEPTNSIVDWQVDTFKDDPSYLGMAIGMGHVKYSSKWSLPKTEINLNLSGDQMEALIIINYRGIEYSELIFNENKRRESEGL